MLYMARPKLSKRILGHILEVLIAIVMACILCAGFVGTVVIAKFLTR